MRSRATHHILLVEDDPADANLVRLALRHSVCPITLHHVGDGQACLDYLAAALKSPGATAMPQLVLLDLNLPKVSGREVLRHLRQHPVLQTLPVVILSTSVARDDIVTCFRQGANSFHSKPMDFDDFTALIQSLTQYWLTKVALPG